MSRHIKPSFEDPVLSRFETLVARARKMRGRGEGRKALVALREACLLDERCAWVWTLYGALLAREGRSGEAQQAYRHALWLRKSSKDMPRARVTQGLLDDLGPASAAA